MRIITCLIDELLLSVAITGRGVPNDLGNYIKYFLTVNLKIVTGKSGIFSVLHLALLKIRLFIKNKTFSSLVK